MIEEIKVYDGVIPKDIVDQTEIAIGSDSFSWHWNESTVDGLEGPDFPQLVHPLKHESPDATYAHLDLFDECRYQALESAKKILHIASEQVGHRIRCLHRIKANLTWKQDITMGMKHVDNETDYFRSIIYYVNDADGDTVFFSGEEEIKRVKPKRGRFVSFPSNIFHAGECPQTHDRRMVINYVYVI